MNTSLIMCQDRLSPLFEKRSSSFFEGGRLEEREEMRENFFFFFLRKVKTHVWNEFLRPDDLNC